jgi:hypothetical protein
VQSSQKGSPAIFISYRRSDSEGQSGRLFKDLCERFGKDAVFIDVARMKKGLDFRRVLDEQLASCGVLLTIIGDGWLNALDEEGKRRLDDPHDFTRTEIAAALKRDIPVIPVLVQDARMPHADQLPDDLKELIYRDGVELRHTHWDSDVNDLMNALTAYVSVPAPASKGGTSKKPILIAIAAMALLGLGLAGFKFYRDSTQNDFTAAKNAAQQTTSASGTTQPGARSATGVTNKAKPIANATDNGSKEAGPSTAATSEPPVANSMEYTSFAAALSAAFADAANDFATFKGAPAGINFIPKMKITDRRFSASNIFHREKAWGFRFLDDGPVNEELAESEKTQAAIEEVFRKNRLKATKAVMPSKDNRVESYRYTRLPYIIEFTRALPGARFVHEIIILHRGD